MQHHPPFTLTEDEADSYYNFHQVERAEYLSLLRQYGAEYVLAGHIHRVDRIGVTAPTILTVTGTNYSYDNNGLGYRVIRVLRDGVKDFYVRLDQPATGSPEPPAQLAYESSTPASLTFSWSEPASPVGVVRYLITRDGVALGYAFEERFTDTGLAPAKRYTYPGDGAGCRQ